MHKGSIVYIAGAGGLIGSAINRKLNKLGYSNIIVKSRKELDLTNQHKVEQFFKKYLPEYVFMCAGKTGGIIANNTYTADFIYDNIMLQTNIINSAFKYKAKKLLYFGCSCMYPKECKMPIKPEYLLTGKIEPTNEPYAIAKISGLKMCNAYNKQHKTNFITIVPANVYGINDDFEEGGHVIANLIKRFHNAKIKNKDKVIIWGTGKPKRDFIFSDDVADASIFLMDKYDGSDIINAGSGREVSIKQLADIIKKIVGFKGRIVYDTTKPDGMMRRCLDSSKIQQMGWKPRTSLEDGIKMSYLDYTQTKVCGYRK